MAHMDTNIRRNYVKDEIFSFFIQKTVSPIPSRTKHWQWATVRTVFFCGWLVAGVYRGGPCHQKLSLSKLSGVSIFYWGHIEPGSSEAEMQTNSISTPGSLLEMQSLRPPRTY